MDQLRRDVNTCFMASIPGTAISPEAAQWIDDGLGSVILFAHNIESREQVTELIAQLHKRSPSLLVSVDEESGDVTRLEHQTGSSFPGSLALGTVDDIALTRAVAESIGDLVASVGANIECAPSADVNTNAGNPVIGPRSFGADPALVARHVTASIAGIQSRGVAAAVKHFPGHGATESDSHYHSVVVKADLDSLQATELVPFRAAIDAGVQAVMSSHVIYPAWDDAPATVSRRILTDLLRDELGFDGVAITDSMSMAAISETLGIPDGCVAALAAGADLLCVAAGIDAAREARDRVLEAVREGRLSGDRVAEAAARVRRLQRWAASPGPGDGDPSIGLVAARRALLVDADVPLNRAPYVIDAGARVRPGVGVTSASLLDQLQILDPSTDGTLLLEPPDDVAAIVGAAGDRPLVVAVREAHRSDWKRALVEHALSVRPDCIVVGTGTPHDAALAPGRYVGTLGCARVNIQAAAERLLDVTAP